MSSEVDARLEELRLIRGAVDSRIKQLEEAKTLQRPVITQPVITPDPVEAKLLKLPWSLAASKKCEYNREVPAALLAEARKAADAKGELDGEKFHYVIKGDGAILRFRRRSS